MKKNALFTSLIFLATAMFLWAAEHGVEILEPEEKSFIAQTETSIKISASKKKSSVYINNEYFGTTPITITDLTAATYAVRVEKQGFEKKSFLVEVKRGLHQEYFVELEKVLVEEEPPVVVEQIPEPPVPAELSAEVEPPTTVEPPTN